MLAFAGRACRERSEAKVSNEKKKKTYPMPVPTHILVTPIFSPLLLSS